MKVICKGISMLLILMLLSGCGERGGSGEVEKDGTVPDVFQTEEVQVEQELKNGERITRQLTEQVLLDAEVRIPESGLEGIEICRVERTGFDGADLASKLLPGVPLEAWEKTEGGGRAPEWEYLYNGDFGAETGGQTGWAGIGSNITKTTWNWNKYGEHLPIYSSGGSAEPLIYGGMAVDEDFSFASRKEAEAEAIRYLTEELGLEGAAVVRTYSANYQQLEERQEMVRKSLEELPGDDLKPGSDIIYAFGEEDNCYYILLERTLNGLPLLSNQISWQNRDVYIPGQKMEVGYTKDGMELVSVRDGYEILERKPAELLPVEEIFESLQRKYEMMLGGKTTFDEMKLIYFPYPLETAANQFYQYDMTPVWQFRIRQGDYVDYVYINALDGVEVTG